MRHRPVALLFACCLLLLPASTPLAQSEFAETARAWRAWAVDALQSPPDGIRLYPELAERLLELINERRTGAGEGLAALTSAPGLERTAQAHAIDMLRRDFIGHANPDGLQPGDRVGLLARRYVGSVGENVAEHEGLARDALASQLGPLAVKLADGFMASPGHRENIVRPDYTHQGLAAATAGDRLVVAHVFGLRRALLTEELAFQVQTGASLPLTFEQDSAEPAGFAFKQPNQPVDEVVVLELSSNTVSVEPGLWRLVFMFQGGRAGVYQVADGPFIEVD